MGERRDVGQKPAAEQDAQSTAPHSFSCLKLLLSQQCYVPQPSVAIAVLAAEKQHPPATQYHNFFVCYSKHAH
jgi:hypothetical protein